jgi:hypothetical protein
MKSHPRQTEVEARDAWLAVSNRRGTRNEA